MPNLFKLKFDAFKQVNLRDGVKRDVFYNITPDQSVILSGQVIDWCVVGLDRAHVDGPNCRRVTPKNP